MQKKPIEALIKLVGGDAEPEKMTSNKLLPCPFCGGEAKECVSYSYAAPSARAYVQCTVCKGSTSSIKGSIDYCAKDKAVEAWNSRVTEKEKAAPGSNRNGA